VKLNFQLLGIKKEIKIIEPIYFRKYI